MSYALAVKIIYGFDDLCEDITCLIFGKMLARGLFNTFKEIVRGATRNFGRAEMLKGDLVLVRLLRQRRFMVQCRTTRLNLYI